MGFIIGPPDLMRNPFRVLRGDLLAVRGLKQHLPRHCVIFRSAKYPSVPGPTHRATAPSESPSFISLTIRQGSAAPWTNSRAFVPSTTIRYFVHTPGSRSTYDSYFSGDSFRSRSKSNSGCAPYCVE